MYFNEQHPLNKKIVANKKVNGVVAISSPKDHPDPYMRSGSHPDVIERIWIVLGKTLPQDCSAMVYGSPALVSPKSGVIIAQAYGTAYILRVPERRISEAKELGYENSHFFSSSRNEVDLEKEFGSDWVFGKWNQIEQQWILDVYNFLEQNI